MHVTLLLPLTLVSFVLAATPAPARSSVNIFAVAYPVVAYMLESEKDVATTYLVACRKGVQTKDCDFNQPYTLIEGLKTAKWSYVASTGGLAQQLTLGCVLEGTTSMGCKATGLAEEGETTTETFTWTGKEASTRFRDILLVTDSASLLTYTPVKSASSSSVQSTKSSQTSSTKSPSSTKSSTKVTIHSSSSTRASITPPPTKRPSNKLFGPVSTSTTDSTTYSTTELTGNITSTTRPEPSENLASLTGPSSVSPSVSSMVLVLASSSSSSSTPSANVAAPGGIGGLTQVVLGGMAVVALVVGRL